MSLRRSEFALQLAGLLWIAGFLWYFFNVPLPNVSPADIGLTENHESGADGVSRFAIWRQFYPGWHSLPNPLDFDTAQTQNVDSGWKYLPQRIPYGLTAAILFASAWLIGSVVTRRLTSPSSVTHAERFVIQAGVGLSALSLWVLMIGRLAMLSRSAVLLPGVVAVVAAVVAGIRSKQRRAEVVADSPRESAGRGPVVLAAFALAPFVLMLILGAMTPPWDFDVREYHMQGPKEWFRNGRITFLEHNVYTSFPFLSEMLSLAAMVLDNDWRSGAISGKLLLSSFQLLTTVCVFATARRWFGRSAGLIAAVVYLTTPWTFRISIIAYAEGALTFYLAAAVMTALLAARSTASNQDRLWLVTGLLAGSAMAAKYPGALSVVAPVGLFLLFTTARRRLLIAPGDSPDTVQAPSPTGARPMIRRAVLFASAVLITVGPWLVKNTIDTGNPVYPLLYSVFGGTDWSEELNLRWKAGHSPADHNVHQIPQYLADVAARSDWTNGLLFALAVPSFLMWRRFPAVAWLWLMVLWMLSTWWAFTHRIDRFWIPVIPVMSVLAGACWQLFSDRPFRIVILAAVAACCVFNLGFWKIPRLAGFQAGLMDLTAPVSPTIRSDFSQMNRIIPAGATALMVGEAEVFDAQFDTIYNTVFDENIFERWTEAPDDIATPARNRRMVPPPTVSAVLKEHSVSFVVVNWSEILRYRQPGSYGFTDYVQPRRFNELVAGGVLEVPATLTHGDWNRLSDADRGEILSWDDGRSLVHDGSWTAIEIYRVADDTKTSAQRPHRSP
ncbi:MAG: glycosyltransferase family 39 protein [Planctomycetaceae bacterium]